MHTSTRTLFCRRQDQLAGKSTYSLTKISPGIKWSAHVHTFIYSCVRKKSSKCKEINLSQISLRFSLEVRRLTEHGTVSVHIFPSSFIPGRLNTLEQLQNLQNAKKRKINMKDFVG